MSECLSLIGKHRYLMCREVTIIEIWECFHLIKVKDLLSDQLLVVDICTVTDEPIFVNSIPLQLFEEEFNERTTVY